MLLNSCGHQDSRSSSEASWRLEVRFCTLQDPCQIVQTLTTRGCVHKECNKLLCGCVLVYCFTRVASHTLT